MSVVIGRRINGITLNSLEYVLDEYRDPIQFLTEEGAKQYLIDKGIKEEDLAYYEYPECSDEFNIEQETDEIIKRNNNESNMNLPNIYEMYDKRKNCPLNKVVKYDFFDRKNEESVFYDSIQDAYTKLNPEKSNEDIHELNMRTWLNTHNDIITEDVHEIEHLEYSGYNAEKPNDPDNNVTRLEVKLSSHKDTNILDISSFTTKEGELITKITFIPPKSDINNEVKYYNSYGNEVDGECFEEELGYIKVKENK